MCHFRRSGDVSSDSDHRQQLRGLLQRAAQEGQVGQEKGCKVRKLDSKEFLRKLIIQLGYLLGKQIKYNKIT